MQEIEQYEYRQNSSIKSDKADVLDIITGIEVRKHFYWCCSCNNFGSVEVCWSNVRSKVTGFDNSQIEISDASITHNIRCTICQDYMVELDPIIAEVIVNLNKVGLETLFCCDGHIRTMRKFVSLARVGKYNFSELPYVIIAKQDDLKQNIDSILSSDKYSYITVEYCNDDGIEDSEWTKVGIYGSVINNDSAMLEQSRSQLLSFINELIKLYK